MTGRVDRSGTTGVDVVVTIANPGRERHLLAQHRGLAEHAPRTAHLLVRMGAPDWNPWPDAWTVDVPVDGPLPLAAARNAGLDAAVAAGARRILALDVDCVLGVGADLAYGRALRAHPGTVVAGPVTYLDPGVDPDAARLAPLTRPHPARPAPADGDTRVATDDEYRLFWSLSFALAAGMWSRLRAAGGGFHEGFRGYGGEDTDFGFALRAAGVPLVWAGGAHAYHQHHPVSSPPVEHLDDILVNGAEFARRWGTWPMEGWFAAFAERGLVVADGAGGWRRAAGVSGPADPPR